MFDGLEYLIYYDFPENPKEYMNHLSSMPSNLIQYAFIAPSDIKAAHILIGIMRESSQFIEPELIKLTQRGKCSFKL